MRTIENLSKEVLDTDQWIDKYLGLPYQHLGLGVEGIDCFNLCRLVYKEVLGINIPYSTRNFKCDPDEQWYSGTLSPKILEDNFTLNYGWILIPIEDIKPFDVVLLSIGATNGANHCALYLPNRKLLHTMIGKTSWIAPYGRYYKQYTVKVGRWNLDYDGNFEED